MEVFGDIRTRLFICVFVVWITYLLEGVAWYTALLILPILCGGVGFVSKCDVPIELCEEEEKEEDEEKDGNDPAVEGVPPTCSFEEGSDVLFQRLEQMSRADDWVHVSVTNDGLDVSRSAHRFSNELKECRAFRFVGVRAYNLNEVTRTLCNSKNWPKIDRNVAKIEISQTNPNTYRLTTKRISLFEPRSSVVRFACVSRDGKTYVGFYGVSEHDFDDDVNTKAMVWVEGAILETTDPGWCRATYFSVTDPNLWIPIPNFLAIRITQTRLRQLEFLTRHVEETGMGDSPAYQLLNVVDSHSFWRSAYRKNGVVVWFSRSNDTCASAKASVFLHIAPDTCTKLLWYPDFQYELLGLLSSRENITPTTVSVPYSRETRDTYVFFKSSFWSSVRIHSRIQHHIQRIGETWVVSFSSPTPPYTIRPSGWTIETINQGYCRVSFVMQTEFAGMRRGDVQEELGKSVYETLLNLASHTKTNNPR